MVGTSFRWLLYVGPPSLAVYNQVGMKRRSTMPSSASDDNRYVAIRYGAQLAVLRHESNLKQLQRRPSIRLEEVISRKTKSKSTQSTSID